MCHCQLSSPAGKKVAARGNFQHHQIFDAMSLTNPQEKLQRRTDPKWRS